MAASGNLAEVDLGQLALNTSSNDSVKMFAQLMIMDHGKAMTSLDSLASQYDNVTLPSTIDSAHAAMKTQLMALNGNAFDSAYIHGQIADHMKTISLFQGEASNGDRQALKDFANKSLPMLNMHLQLADSVAAHIQ